MSAKSLSNLPFPISELSWDKLPQIQKHLKLTKGEAFTILTHVLGPKNPDPEPVPRLKIKHVRLSRIL